MKPNQLYIITLITLLLPLFAVAATSTNYWIDVDIVNAGAGYSTSTSYLLEDSLPFISAIGASSTSYNESAGFFSADPEEVDETTDNPNGGGSYPNNPNFNPLTTALNKLKELLGLSKPVDQAIEKITKETAEEAAKKPVLAFLGLWDLIPPEPVRELVFRPLPENIKNLAANLPEFGTLLSNMGIKGFNDLERIKETPLPLPGLNRVLALSGVQIPGTNVERPERIRLEDLSSETLEKFPEDSVYARIAHGLVDVQPWLRINSEGQKEEQISVLTDKDIFLSVKPGFPAKSVYGLLILKPRVVQNNINTILGSVVPTAKAAETQAEVDLKDIETALVLDSFVYQDQDGDGIYTATVRSPVVAGSYEVITIIEYVDPERGSKALRLVTVVDPEGYVYKTSGGNETRIKGAIISLQWLNPETKEYQLWPADEYGQTNPQITNENGQYSFLVPEGYYQLSVNAPGLKDYQGEAFLVRGGKGVHENIELKTPFAFATDIDWSLVAICIIGTLFLYHLIQERKKKAPKLEIRQPETRG